MQLHVRNDPKTGLHSLRQSFSKCLAHHHLHKKGKKTVTKHLHITIVYRAFNMDQNAMFNKMGCLKKLSKIKRLSSELALFIDYVSGKVGIASLKNLNWTFAWLHATERHDYF